MKHVVILFLCSLALVLAVSGCASPKLVSRAMTPHELEWSLDISASYPAWRPPFLSPVEPIGERGEVRPLVARPAVPAPAVPAPAVPAPAGLGLDVSTSDEVLRDDAVEFVPAEDGK